jgi:hypothetical protein
VSERLGSTEILEIRFFQKIGFLASNEWVVPKFEKSDFSTEEKIGFLKNSTEEKIGFLKKKSDFDQKSDFLEKSDFSTEGKIN